MKMNSEYKKEWLKDLRSGVIKQARGGLRLSDDSMCCLGVLANVHAKFNPEFAATQVHESSYDGMGGSLSHGILKQVGFSCKVQDDLIDMNDYSRMSFKQIARWIEKNL